MARFNLSAAAGVFTVAVLASTAPARQKTELFTCFLSRMSKLQRPCVQCSRENRCFHRGGGWLALAGNSGGWSSKGNLEEAKMQGQSYWNEMRTQGQDIWAENTARSSQENPRRRWKRTRRPRAEQSAHARRVETHFRLRPNECWQPALSAENVDCGCTPGVFITRNTVFRCKNYEKERSYARSNGRAF